MRAICRGGFLCRGLLRVEGRVERMKPSPLYSIVAYQQEVMEDEGVLAVGMDVDDADTLEVFGELDRQPADADFFNSFEDDFDDSDI